MEAEAIAFLFSRPEMDALMILLGLEGIPFCPPDPKNLREGERSLERRMLISRGGGKTLVDKVAALLARTVSGSEFLCVHGEKTYWGVFRAEPVCAVLRIHMGRWVVTPFQTCPAALEAALACAPDYSEGLIMTAKNSRGGENQPYIGETPPREFLRQAANDVFRGDASRKEDEAVWRQ